MFHLFARDQYQQYNIPLSYSSLASGPSTYAQIAFPNTAIFQSSVASQFLRTTYQHKPHSFTPNLWLNWIRFHVELDTFRRQQWCVESNTHDEMIKSRGWGDPFTSHATAAAGRYAPTKDRLEQGMMILWNKKRTSTKHVIVIWIAVEDHLIRNGCNREWVRLGWLPSHATILLWWQHRGAPINSDVPIFRYMY